VLAAIVGGVVVFVWESIAHVALPLGEMGLSALPNEAPVLESLHASVPKPGLYFFPAPAGTSKEQQAAWEAKIRTVALRARPAAWPARRRPLCGDSAGRR
jgi:hypothetical protein